MIHRIKKLIFLFPLLWIVILCSNAQQVTLIPDQVTGYTAEWKGEWDAIAHRTGYTVNQYLH